MAPDPRSRSGPRHGQGLALALGALLVGAVTARGGDLQHGDVVLAVGSGFYQVRASDGTLRETLDTGLRSFASGCVIGPDRALYLTNWGLNHLVVMDGTHPHAIRLDIVTNGVTGRPDTYCEDVTVDGDGNILVTHSLGGGEVHLYQPDGTLAQEVPTQPKSDWFDLASDQRTLFYDSESGVVHRVDVPTGAQLPDFSAAAGMFALRLLSPGDGTGGLLAVRGGGVDRLDASGSIVTTYLVPGARLLFALSLDPDGTTFWTADHDSGRYVRIDLATGAIVGDFDAGVSGIGGICVVDEPRAAVRCGNGVLDPGEECDDGNRLDGDGCDALCKGLVAPCAPGVPLPEASPLQLRVTRASLDAIVSFATGGIGAVAEHANVYRGSVAAFRSVAHYDHAEAPGGCGLTSSPYVDIGAGQLGTGSHYYLVVLACPDAGADREGSYGQSQSSSGSAERPHAVDLGTLACP